MAHDPSGEPPCPTRPRRRPTACSPTPACATALADCSSSSTRPTATPRSPPTRPSLAIYDWEIAKDTEIELAEVRTSLRLLDGTAITLGTVQDEHRVVSLADADELADVA